MCTKKDEPTAIWKERDCFGGRTVEAMVVILRTKGCAWARNAGCLMCGYNAASDASVEASNLERQVTRALERYEGEEMVKIYTSGSFLDQEEIPPPVRDRLLGQFDQAERILVESRPEFIRHQVLEDIDTGRLMVAIGLETANDEYLRRCVRKGFLVQDYDRAAMLLGEMGIPLRTYLLLKPPFLTERDGMVDAIRSVEHAARASESVSINPVNVQRGTLVERLWRRGSYRPPWLWSLVEVLTRSRTGGKRVLSSPSGGGTPRGVHNCQDCDDKILEAVERFSFTQDQKEFNGIDCRCRQEWKALVEVQDAMATSVDLARVLGLVPGLED